MTNTTFTTCLRRRAAPLVGLLLFAACHQQSGPQPPGTRSAAGAAAADKEASRPLIACAAPELQPIHSSTTRSARTVAYPGDELDRPGFAAQPFAEVDPQLPLPPVVQPRSHVRGVNPLRDEEHEPVPPVVTMGEPLPLQAPERVARRPSRPTPGSYRPLPPRNFRGRPRVASSPSLPPLPSPVRPSGGMQAVNHQVEQMIRRGYHLAERGALYSARAEFIQALGTIAQALDLESQSRQHTQALAAGLTALEEAEDFLPTGAGLETDLDMAMLIRAHRTPACKEMDTAGLLSVTALQRYYTFAQEQLAWAAGGAEAPSMALFSLGKTYSTLAQEKTLPAAVAEPKAMVFHWAALTAHAGNFLAANELAVLEARWGQYATARSLLQYSLAILPHSAVWRNLAAVHQQLGETKLAELAMREADLVGQREATAKPGNPEGIVPSSDVEWLDSKAFAATSRSEIDVQKPIAANETSTAVKAKPVVAPAPPRQRSAMSWFPLFR